LEDGPAIKVGKSRHSCLPCVAILLKEAPKFPERNPPIRVRKTVPDSWLQLTLREGKNRQVRKMCAAIGYPVLRLLRTAIEGLNLEEMTLGELKEVDKEFFYEELKLNKEKS
jgi:23S rRNA pseudouridine2457 synthase